MQTCLICKDDLSGRKGSPKYCLKCARDKNKQASKDYMKKQLTEKFCKVCGESLGKVKYRALCETHKYQRIKERNKKPIL